jgi:hypothetical protein
LAELIPEYRSPQDGARAAAMAREAANQARLEAVATPADPAPPPGVRLVSP